MDQQEFNQNNAQKNNAQQNDNPNNQLWQGDVQPNGNQQSGMNQPNMYQSVMNQPGMNQPNTNQPGMNQLNMNQPNMNQPNMNQPGMNQPGMNQPYTNQPGMNQPYTNQPNMNQPNMNQPNMNQPNMNQPYMNQPNMNQPYMNQPNMNQPNMNQQYMNQPNMNQPNMNQPYMNQPNWNQQGYPMGQWEVQSKKIWSRSMLGLFIMGMVVILIQVITSAIVQKVAPQLPYSGWYVWALTAFTMICVALPLLYFVTKPIPNSPKGEVVKLKASQFFKYFLVSAAVMYITNFISILILIGIAMIKGQNFNDLNPLTNLFTSNNIAYAILYAAIAAPIVEELIFRKILLDKLRRYGDVPAILITAFAFGMFHMNLAQFFYAMALGIIFAYVTIRTNTVRYSILLHIMINSIGTAVTPLATQPNTIFPLIMSIWVFGAIAAGVVILVLNIKKIKLYKALPLARKSDYFLNVGTILYTIMCLVMIVIATVS